MKRVITLLSAAMLIANAFAQAPEKMSYQAVVRDAGNALVTSQAVGMQLSILQGSVSGTAVYVETQNPTTNINGLVSIEIGAGTVISGTFNTIDWSVGPYFIKTETDPTGGTAYTITGTSQMMSVPYALYAKTAANATNDMVDDADADSTNELQDWSNLPGIPAGLADGIDNVDDADADPNNEIQAISFSNDTLYLSNGGQVYLGAYGVDLVDDADSDPTNELQNWSTLPGIPGAFADNIDNVDDADNDPNNEIQDISLTGTDLTISSGSTVDLSVVQDGVDDADNDPNNELQVLSTNGDTIFISNGNYIVIDGLTNPIATGNGVPLPFDFPDYYTYTGDCSEGNFISQGVDTLVGFSHSYCNFNLQSGHLLHLRAPGWNGTGMSSTMKITVSDTCFIRGTISGVGPNENCKATSGSSGSNATYTVAAGGGQRGYPRSGGCTSCPTGVLSVSLTYDSHLPGTTLLPGPPSYSASTFGCQNTVGLNGDDGKSVPDSTLFYAIQIRPNGLGGIHGINAGGPAPCGPTSYTGGCGGIGLEIRCRVLVFDGSIDLSGGNGRNGCSGCSIGGGGGAGGAGSLIIAADDIIVNTGTIIQNGGIGGNGFGSGTKGGNGGSGDQVILEY